MTITKTNIYVVAFAVLGAIAAVAFLPLISEAATLGTALGVVSAIINTIIPIVLAIAVLIFFWGLAMYLFNAGDSDKRIEGINIMVMGTIAIFVMVSVWGIIRVLQETFSVQDTQPIIPDVIQRSKS